MPASSLASPSADPKVRSVIEDATRRLVAEFQPEQIWLFGSYAWGEPNEDSDLDFLVVVSHSDERPVQRMRRAGRCLRGLGMAKDVLVKTRADFDKFKDVVSSLTFKIIHDGRLLHG